MGIDIERFVVYNKDLQAFIEILKESFASIEAISNRLGYNSDIRKLSLNLYELKLNYMKVQKEYLKTFDFEYLGSDVTDMLEEVKDANDLAIQLTIQQIEELKKSDSA